MSKGVTFKLDVTPLLTCGLLHSFGLLHLSSPKPPTFAAGASCCGELLYVAVEISFLIEPNASVFASTA